jgi:hypothetical protein
MALFLVSLLLVLTFNAYACLLPLPAQSAMDCSSPSDEPVRETCDAFLELGPQSEFSSDNSLSVQLEFEILSPSHSLLHRLPKRQRIFRFPLLSSEFDSPPKASIRRNLQTSSQDPRTGLT